MYLMKMIMMSLMILSNCAEVQEVLRYLQINKQD